MYYDIEASSRRIKALGIEHQSTQESVAEYIGISLDGYRKLERGVNDARGDTLLAIAELYGVSLDYLVCGQNEKSKNAAFANLTEGEVKFLFAILRYIIE